VLYYETTEARVAKRASGNDRESLCIPTGIARVDRMLGGGIAPGELGLLMGPMKRGKTLCAINFSKGAMALGGKNVVHYTVESSEDRTQTLYDAMISDVERDDLKRHSEEVSRRVKSFFESEVNGRLMVKYFSASSCSATDLETNLQKIKLMNNFVPQLLIIDYLGLLKPADFRMMGSGGGKYEAYGIITKELLSLAQRGNYAIWLIHQSTRGSLKKEKVDLDDSGDSIEPMRDADIILTIGQNEVEAQLDPPQIRLFVAGGREIPSRTTTKLCIDTKRCKIWDPTVMA
jgi:replicative DNA helicase